LFAGNSFDNFFGEDCSHMKFQQKSLWIYVCVLIFQPFCSVYVTIGPANRLKLFTKHDAEINLKRLLSRIELNGTSVIIITYISNISTLIMKNM